MARGRSVGENIRAYRKARKLTQQELADRVGLTRQQINRIETGQQGTTLERLDKIAEALGVPRAAIIDEGGLYPLTLEDLPQSIDPVVAIAILSQLPADVREWLKSSGAKTWLAFCVKADQQGLTPEQAQQALYLYRAAKECLSRENTDSPKE